MQTWLPVPNIQLSLRSLDSKRLNKQRLENAQIWRLISEPAPAGTAYANHPGVLAWHSNLGGFAAYLNATLREWEDRGFVNCFELLPKSRVDETNLPWWFGHPAYHTTHKCRLLRKDRAFYSSRFNFPFAKSERSSSVMRKLVELYGPPLLANGEFSNTYFGFNLWPLRSRNLFYKTYPETKNAPSQHVEVEPNRKGWELELFRPWL